MVLSPAGRSAYVSSTGPEHEAAGVGPGDRVTKKLRAATRPYGGRDLRIRSAGGGARFVYEISRGRVVSVGVATDKAAGTPAALRSLVALSKLGG
jgi:hypothetical protein